VTACSKVRHSVHLALVASLAACASNGTSESDTDELTGQVASALSTTSVTFAGDELRTGWYSDESALAPSVVGGGTFGQLFATTNISGQVYAQPLVSNGTLFIATEGNVIYGLDPATGRPLWSRTLATAVATRDLPGQCTNIAPTVGVTGTPVIDRSTNIAYFLSKAYLSGASGAIGYFAHAVNVSSGSEVSGFPVQIQGSATNDASQTFNAQAQLQRPGLLLMNGVVYAGFGSHCDIGPAVGWIVGFTTAGQVKTLWTTEAGMNKTILGSVWAPGALASDRSGQILFVTGNGVSSTVTTGPGASPPAALPESAVRVAVQADGSLKATDYFSPFDTAALDTNDFDFGSSSPLLLPSTFGTTAIPNLMVTGSKGGILYLLNRDSLGGRGQGTIGKNPGGDAVLEEIGPFPPNTLGSVGMWTKPGVWPGDGAYVYTVEASEGSSPAFLRAFKSGLDSSGKPTLTAAGASNVTFGFSSGSPMVTSNGTTAGSALVWVEFAVGAGSSGAELRAYDAVPVGGVLNERWHASIGQMANFASPGIAGGRVYVGTRDGRVLGFGAAGGGADAGADAATDAGMDATTSGGGCASGAVVISVTSCSSLPSFNTTNAVCVKTKVATINGWNASNVQGRTVTAKGATTQGPITPTNASIPNQPGLSAGSDGFVYFNFTAGSVNYTSMACW
jgi:PQQ-like domain